MFQLNQCLYTLKHWVQTKFQTKVQSLIQNIMENRNRHARGPVQTSVLLHEQVFSAMIYISQSKDLLQTCLGVVRHQKFIFINFCHVNNTYVFSKNNLIYFYSVVYVLNAQFFRHKKFKNKSSRGSLGGKRTTMFAQIVTISTRPRATWLLPLHG